MNFHMTSTVNMLRLNEPVRLIVRDSMPGRFCISDSVAAGCRPGLKRYSVQSLLGVWKEKKSSYYAYKKAPPTPPRFLQ
jgi:hypothetical protein